MEWKVCLSGDEFDLSELSKSFCGPGLAIVREEERFVLKSSRFSELNDAEAIRHDAARIVVLLDGGARLALGARRPITLGGGIERINDDGSRDAFAFPDTLRLAVRALAPSVRVTHSDGTEQEFNPADPVVGWVKAGLGSETVARVLGLFASKPLDWVNLYRILEVVESDMGGLKSIAQQGWATRAGLRRFKRSANSPSAIGDDARHGKEPTQPAADPMTLSEARSFIETILHNWLRTKQNP
jgi:hypothetical protein